MTLSSTVGLFSTSTVTMERSPIVINVSLCLFAYLKNYMSKLHQFFLCVLPTAVVYYCFGDVVICDVLPVL